MVLDEKIITKKLALIADPIRRSIIIYLGNNKGGFVIQKQVFDDINEQQLIKSSTELSQLNFNKHVRLLSNVNLISHYYDNKYKYIKLTENGMKFYNIMLNIYELEDFVEPPHLLFDKLVLETDNISSANFEYIAKSLKEFNFQALSKLSYKQETVLLKLPPNCDKSEIQIKLNKTDKFSIRFIIKTFLKIEYDEDIRKISISMKNQEEVINNFKLIFITTLGQFRSVWEKINIIEANVLQEILNEYISKKFNVNDIRTRLE